MITLRDLAGWEDHLGSVVRRTVGSAEERDRTLARDGVYADYSAVFGSYASLVSEDPDGLEALKRATFLAWFAVVEPSFLTGIGDLPESTVRRVVETLDVQLRAEPVDAELRFMVPWYVSQSELALLRVPGLRAIERLADQTAADPLEKIPYGSTQFEGRGLMGAYWRTVTNPPG